MNLLYEREIGMFWNDVNACKFRQTSSKVKLVYCDCSHVMFWLRFVVCSETDNEYDPYVRHVLKYGDMTLPFELFINILFGMAVIDQRVRSTSFSPVKK